MKVIILVYVHVDLEQEQLWTFHPRLWWRGAKYADDMQELTTSCILCFPKSIVMHAEGVQDTFLQTSKTFLFHHGEKTSRTWILKQVILSWPFDLTEVLAGLTQEGGREGAVVTEKCNTAMLAFRKDLSLGCFALPHILARHVCVMLKSMLEGHQLWWIPQSAGRDKCGSQHSAPFHRYPF